jgi:SNF2 family DNA or RNA helicase
MVRDGWIFLDIPYSDKEKAREIGGKWEKSIKQWRFPYTWHVLVSLVQQIPILKYDNTLISHGKYLRQTRETLLSILAKEDTEGHPSLRPYQRVDVEYLKEIEHCGIFSEMRTGKSPTSIVLASERGLYPILVVCPASLKYNWKNEVERWGVYDAVFVVDGTSKQRQKIYDEFTSKVSSGERVWLVTNYESAKGKDFGFYQQMDWGGMIVDEAHRLRNAKTQQTRAIKEIGKHARHRIGLSGTPTVKSGLDLFGILQFLYPERFGSYWDFVKRYFDCYTTFDGHFEVGDYRQDTFGELSELLAFMSVRRLRSDVMKWLPPKQYQTIPVQMGKKQQKAYDDMLNDFAVELEDGEEVDASTILTQLIRLRQIALDPELLGVEAESAKTDALLDILEDRDNPTVIMSMFTSYLKKLEPTLAKRYKVAMIHGEVKQTERQRIVEDFQAGKIDVLLCNIISGGEGLTLDKSDLVIFTDNPWNPSEKAQAEDRITPTSENKNHSFQVITLVSMNTVDERIQEILEQKKSVTEILNNGGREAIRRLLNA